MAMHLPKLLVALVVTATSLMAAPAHASEPFPSKPIRVVVPFAPGGPADSAARKLATALTQELGQQLVVDNRAGGGGVIAANTVISAQPDGYTLLFGAVSGLAFTGKINPVITYDSLKDLTPVSLTHVYPLFFIVPASTPAKTLREFIDYAKASSRRMNYGSAGTGTTSHLCVEALKSAAGIDITHVPYRGSSLALADLLANRLDLMCDAFTAQKPHVESGALRVLAVASTRRSDILPSAPAAPESGVPGLEIASWFALMAPKGTPPEIRSRIAAAVAKVQGTDEMKAWGKSLGVEAVSNTPDEMTAFLVSERSKWEKLVTDAGVRFQ